MRHRLIETLESRMMLNAADVDLSFGSGGRTLTPFPDSAADAAGAAAVQPDGRLLVAGVSQAAFGLTQFAVARYNANGSLDGSFAIGGSELLPLGKYFQASDMALQGDGKILIAGETSPGVSGGQFAILRLNTNGTLDSTFNGIGEQVISLGGADDASYRLALQGDEKIVLAGRTKDSMGVSHFAIARVNANGALDSTFGNAGYVTTTISPGGSDVIVGITIDSAGRILAAGSTQPAGSSRYESVIARYNSNGTLDTSFGSNGVVITAMGQSGSASGVAVQPDGKIVIGGYSTPSTAHTLFAAARYNANGTLDSTFGTAGLATINDSSSDSARTLRLMPDGHIVLGGVSVPSGASVYSAMVARLTSTGALDTSYNGTGMNIVAKSSLNASVLHSDGTVTAVGGTGASYWSSDFSLIQFNPSGQLDTTFGSGGKVITNFIQPTHAQADAVALQPDGKVVTAGYRYILRPNMNPDLGKEVVLTRYNVDGSPDTTFGSGGEVTTAFGTIDDRANAVVVQPNGDILIAGQTSDPNTGTAFLVARYLPNGAMDPSFGASGQTTITNFSTLYGNPSDIATAIALQSDGSILVAGDASGAGIGIARLTPGGQLDMSYGSSGKAFTSVNVSGPASAIAVDSQGRAVVATTLTSGSSAWVVVARYTTSGQPDTGFGGTGMVRTSIYPTPTTTAISMAPDGKIVVGATAGSSGSATQMALVRYNADGSLDSGFGSGGTFVSSALPSVSALQVLSDGSILISAGTGGSIGLAHVMPAGVLDPSFGTGGTSLTSLGGLYNPQGYAMAIRPNGRVVVAGSGNNDVMVAQFIGFPPLRVVSAAYDYTHPRHALSFILSEDLPSTPPLSSLTVTNRNTAVPQSPTQVTFDHVTHTLTFTFSAALPDGNYQASLSGSITDFAGNHLGGDVTSGNNFTYNFFYLTGDVNHDGTVNLADLLILTRNFGKTAAYAQGDLDGDGTAQLADFLILTRNFGHALPALPALATVSGAGKTAGASPANTALTPPAGRTIRRR